MVQFIGSEDPDERIRREWAELLTEFLEVAGINRKTLQQRLAAVGVDVTTRAIGQWMTGETSPRPSVQAAIAHVMHVPSRAMWPLTFYPDPAS